MQTAKAKVRALLDRLPDDCEMHDVLYHLYVMDAVERGPCRRGGRSNLVA